MNKTTYSFCLQDATTPVHITYSANIIVNGLKNCAKPSFFGSNQQWVWARYSWCDRCVMAKILVSTDEVVVPAGRNREKVWVASPVLTGLCAGFEAQNTTVNITVSNTIVPLMNVISNIIVPRGMLPFTATSSYSWWMLTDGSP